MIIEYYKYKNNLYISGNINYTISYRILSMVKQYMKFDNITLFNVYNSYIIDMEY